MRHRRRRHRRLRGSTSHQTRGTRSATHNLTNSVNRILNSRIRLIRGHHLVRTRVRSFIRGISSILRSIQDHLRRHSSLNNRRLSGNSRRSNNSRTGNRRRRRNTRTTFRTRPHIRPNRSQISHRTRRPYRRRRRRRIARKHPHPSRRHMRHSRRRSACNKFTSPTQIRSRVSHSRNLKLFHIQYHRETRTGTHS